MAKFLYLSKKAILKAANEQMLENTMIKKTKYEYLPNVIQIFLS